MAVSSILVLVLICQVTNTGGQTCQRRSLVTFNVGLTPQVLQYESRRHLVPAAIASSDSDVICIQELWYEEDLKMILDAVSDKYPHSYSFIHHCADNLREPETGWPVLAWFLKQFTALQSAPCLTYKVVLFQLCMIFRCYLSVGNEKLTCMETNCASWFYNLPQECITCLLSSTNPSSSILAKCCHPLDEYSRFNPQGLLLLSRHRIVSFNRARFIPDTKQLIPRGYLEVQVENIGKVICTHLTGNFEGEPYFEKNLMKKGYTSYEQQQREEVLILAKKFANEKHFLMGDLNTGPVIKDRGIDGEYPKNFQLLEANGYSSPYVTNDGSCTYCSDNTLLIGHSNRSLILDHILVQDQEVYSSKRVYGITDDKTTLSDHYGVKVDVCTQT